jgi:hypothetical protein
MVLRSGKHIGKSLVWVEEFDSGYLDWVKINRPEMLKEHSTPQSSKIKTDAELPDSPITAIKPNINFDNEKRDEKIPRE